MRDVKALIAQMTLEEKAGMCSGKDFWRLKSVPRLGIPEVMVSKPDYSEFKSMLTTQSLASCHYSLGIFFLILCHTFIPCALRVSIQASSILFNFQGPVPLCGLSP